MQRFRTFWLLVGLMARLGGLAQTNSFPCSHGHHAKKPELAKSTSLLVTSINSTATISFKIYLFCPPPYISHLMRPLDAGVD